MHPPHGDWAVFPEHRNSVLAVSTVWNNSQFLFAGFSSGSLQGLSQIPPTLYTLAAFSIPIFAFFPDLCGTYSYTPSLTFDNLIWILLFLSLCVCPVSTVQLFISGKAGPATLLYSRVAASGQIMSRYDEVRQQRKAGKTQALGLDSLSLTPTPPVTGCVLLEKFLKKKTNFLKNFLHLKFHISKIRIVILSISLSCCKV